MTLETKSRKSFNPTPHYMDTTVQFPNPTPFPIWLHPSNLSVSGPEIDGHRELAEMRTPEVMFLPGFWDTSFKTWIQIHSIERAERMVTEVIASGSGGPVVVRIGGALTVLLISHIRGDIGKQMNCTATPIDPPEPPRRAHASLLRRSAHAQPQSKMSTDSDGSDANHTVKYRNIKLHCPYGGPV